MNDESISKRISELFNLYKSGALSKDEYEKLKKQILSEQGIENEKKQEQGNTTPLDKPIRVKKGLGMSNIAIFCIAFIIIVICLLIVFPPSSKLEPIKDIDGNVYHTISIGTQVWMTENLKSTRYRDGTAIQLVTDNKTWAELTEPAYCWYQNDVNYNKTICGALYNCFTINTNKLCPYGWHVPTDEEWTTLTTYLGGPGIAATKLESIKITQSEISNLQATNKSGFEAGPTGIRISDGTFIGFGSICYWWSKEAYCQYMDFRLDFIAKGQKSYKGFGYSVRCIRN